MGYKQGEEQGFPAWCSRYVTKSKKRMLPEGREDGFKVWGWRLKGITFTLPIKRAQN